MRDLMALPEVSGRDRIRLYVTTILFQWFLAATVAWRAFARGLTTRQLGVIGEFPASVILIALAGATLIAAAHWMNLRRLARSHHPAAQSLRSIGSRLFPRSTVEYIFYIVLAITAGICEEFVFRGFVIAVLFRAGLGAWTAVILSSLMFGLAHLYQGKGGSAGTALLGMLFAGVKIAYHSIVPVVVWHAVLDIVAGFAGAKYFTGQQPGEPVGQGSLRGR